MITCESCREREAHGPLVRRNPHGKRLALCLTCKGEGLATPPSITRRRSLGATWTRTEVDALQAVLAYARLRGLAQSPGVLALTRKCARMAERLRKRGV